MWQALLDVLLPATPKQLGVFYIAWMLIYALVNILWDAASDRTPAFHLAHLGAKLGVIYNAATFASSLLVLEAVFDDGVKRVAGDVTIPLVLAGLSGLLVALGELCPYKPEPPDA